MLAVGLIGNCARNVGIGFGKGAGHPGILHTRILLACGWSWGVQCSMAGRSLSLRTSRVGCLLRGSLGPMVPRTNVHACSDALPELSAGTANISSSRRMDSASAITVMHLLPAPGPPVSQLPSSYLGCGDLVSSTSH